MPLEQCQFRPPTLTRSRTVFQGLTTLLIHKWLLMSSLNLPWGVLVKFSFGSWPWICRNIWNLSFGTAHPQFCCCFSTMPHACIYFFGQSIQLHHCSNMHLGLEISSRHRLPTFPPHTGAEMLPQQSPRQVTCPFILVLPAQPSSMFAPPQCLHCSPVPSKPDEHRMRKLSLTCYTH